MQFWHDLTHDALPSWIDRWVGRTELPIFILRPPDQAMAQQAWRERAILDGQMRRRPESGLLEFRFPTGFARDEHVSRLREELHQIASQEDRREFTAVTDTGSQVVVAESESWLAEFELPVIGPGGRITIAAEAVATTADIVVRRRERAVPSRWRESHELLANIWAKIEDRAAGHRVASVAGNFGYLELSKYERQLCLRPAFLFSVRIISAGDAAREQQMEWADSVVEPATVSEEFAPSDGLGSMAE